MICFRIIRLRFFLFLFASLSLTAQTLDTGSFRGVVRDEHGQLLPGASLRFEGLDNTVRREVETDKQGQFWAGGLFPGRYRVFLQLNEKVLWAGQLTARPGFELELVIDLQKLRQAAERRQRLDPKLEQERDAERASRQAEATLQNHLNNGVRLFNEGRPELAIESFQAALALEPNRGATHALLGDALAAAGRVPEALAAYRRALQLEPNEAAHHNNLGLVLVREGQLEEAFAHFRRAAQLEPGRAAHYQFNLGAALLNAGRPADAVEPLRLATRADPTLAVAHYFYGVSLLRSSPRSPRAAPEQVEPRAGTREAFQRYLELDPEGPYADNAREYLKQLGVRPSRVTLPATSRAETRE